MRRAPLLLVALLAAGTARAAPPAADPDWPCQQIKVADLSLGALWNGPDVTPYLTTWSQDAAVAALVPRVAQRRLPLDAAQQAIRDFAAASGAQSHPRLLALMAGLFDQLDAERGQVLTGLDRFGRRQKDLASTIRADMAKLRSRQDAADAASQAQVSRLGEQLDWETRLFEQRRQAVAYACDVPNRIEQRLFALARTIQEQLGPATP